MKYLGKAMACALFSATLTAHAGFYGNTVHSRGNCIGFNESITWNWSEYHWWEVESIHFRQKGNGPNTHRLKAWMAYTWRAAALDFWKDPAGENADQYWAQGYHYYMGNNGNRVFDSYTQSGYCGGYNGWWDVDKAKGE